MRQSTRIAQQALERITPRGVFDIQDYRIVPPPKDKVYTEMEALIQHFLIYSQGFTVPAGEVYVPIEGPRGEHGFTIVSDGTNRPYRDQAAGAVVLCLPGTAEADRRRHDCRRHRGHRLDRRRHGRRGSMSFHPLMVYNPRASSSRSASWSTKGPPFVFTPERRAQSRRTADEVSAGPEALGGARGAVSRAGAAGVSHRRTACGTSAGDPRHDAGRSRGRRDLLRDVLQGAGRQVRAAGVPHAVVRADGRRARDRGAVREARDQRRRDRSVRACSRCWSSSASAPAIARRS